MKKSRYLHSLFDHYKASHKIRFLAVGVVFLEITPNNLKVERLPAQVPETNSTNGSTRTQTDDEHFSSFVNALNNLLVKKFPNNANNCISIKYAIPTFFQ